MTSDVVVSPAQVEVGIKDSIASGQRIAIRGADRRQSAAAAIEATVGTRSALTGHDRAVSDYLNTFAAIAIQTLEAKRAWRAAAGSRSPSARVAADDGDAPPAGCPDSPLCTPFAAAAETPTPPPYAAQRMASGGSGLSESGPSTSDAAMTARAAARPLRLTLKAVASETES